MMRIKQVMKKKAKSKFIFHRVQINAYRKKILYTKKKILLNKTKEICRKTKLLKKMK